MSKSGERARESQRARKSRREPERVSEKQRGSEKAREAHRESRRKFIAVLADVAFYPALLSIKH